MADETLAADAVAPEPREGSPPPEEPAAAAEEEAKTEEEEEHEEEAPAAAAEEEAKTEEEEEYEEEAPAAAEETGKRKRGRRRKEAGGATPKKEGTPRVRKKEPAEPKTPVERPSRERKTVERFAALTPQRSASKVLSIEQGPGTKLKDIPNVLFKLNKRKVDDNLHQLHSVLFSKRAKANHIKKNIFQFSGFVWTDNKEKSRAKVREKLDKYNKDRLLDFCDTLDIPVNKAGTKKEDVSAKLLEFLESPHVTRDVLIADKEQSSKKRKRMRKGAREESGEKKKRGRKPFVRTDSNEAEEMEVEGESSGDEEKEAEEATLQDDTVKGESDDDAEESKDDEKDELETPEKKASVAKKGSKSKDTDKETPKKSPDSKSDKISSSHEESEGKKGAKRGRKPAVKASGADKSDVKVSVKKRAAAAKDQDDNNKKKNKKSSKEKNDDKQVLKAFPKANKEKGKTKSSTKADVTPTRDEMHAVVSEILKEVDFNTATLADILKQLGAHFKMDLMDRKAEVKSIIEDVINSMTDDDGDEDGDGSEEKDKADSGSGEGDA